MKYIYIALFVIAVAKAAVIKRNDIENANVDAPKVVRFVTLDPPGFLLEWSPVTSKEETDPVLGYKVKVWEENSEEPEVIVVSGADSKYAEYSKIKFGLQYEIRVQAFTGKGDGPLSTYVGFSLGS